MAQKAAKSLAARNSSRLLQTHLITLSLHLLYHILRLFLLSRKFKMYILLSLPGLATEAYLDLLGRPTYDPSTNQPTKSGADLGAKGLTEYMWDVVYWTWINLGLVILLGDWAWWLYLVVPGYTVYAVATTVGGVREMMSGMGSAGAQGGAQSNRQKKMEKKGQGQRVVYR